MSYLKSLNVQVLIGIVLGILFGIVAPKIALETKINRRHVCSVIKNVGRSVGICIDIHRVDRFGVCRKTKENRAKNDWIIPFDHGSSRIFGDNRHEYISDRRTYKCRGVGNMPKQQR